MSNQPAPPAPGPEADPTMSGPAEAERRAFQTMEENALKQRQTEEKQRLEAEHAHEDALRENEARDLTARLEAEHAHEDALRENEVRDLMARKEAGTDSTGRHKAAIESRITGDDVQALNDRAMFEVYGSEIPVVRKTEKDKPTRRNLEGGREVFEKGSKGVKDTAPKKHEYVKGKASYTVVDPDTGEIIAAPERTVVDPDTGEAIVYPERRLKGKLEDIETNPRYGKTLAERKKAAKAYERDLLSLVENEGLELSQAKLIMDMRENDKEMQIRFAGRLEADGMPRSKAGKKAEEVYKRKDAERLDTIKDEGVFTEQEYAHVRKGGELYNGSETYKDLQNQEEEDDDDPTQEIEDERDIDEYAQSAFYIETPDDLIRQAEHAKKEAATPEEREAAERRIEQLKAERDALDPQILEDLKNHNREGTELLQDLGNALNKYAELQAKFETKMTPFGKKKLEAARKEYEKLRIETNNRTGRFLRSNGFSNEEITEELLGQDVGEYVEGDNGELEEVSRGEAGLVRDVTKKEMERRGKESKFISWWMKMNKKGKKGLIAKAGVMVPVGIAAGVAAGPLIGAGAGAAVAGLGAKRLATGMIRSRADSTANLAQSAQVRTGQRHRDQLKRIGDVEGMIESSKGKNKIYQAKDVTSAHVEDATATNASNTKRAAVSMGVGLAAGGVAGAAADALMSKDLPGKDATQGAGKGTPGEAGEAGAGEGLGEATKDGTQTPPPPDEAPGQNPEPAQHESLSKKGDTISHHAYEQLVQNGNSQPSQAQIMEETQRMLDLNNLSWDDARELPVGYKFRVR